MFFSISPDYSWGKGPPINLPGNLVGLGRWGWKKRQQPGHLLLVIEVCLAEGVDKILLLQPGADHDPDRPEYIEQ